MDQSARQTQEFFNIASAAYAVHKIGLQRLYRARMEQLLEYIPPDRPLRLLDLGSGSGLFADLFLETFTRSTAWCVDFSESMLARQARSDRKRLVLADVKALPASMGQFDVISIDALLHHLIGGGGYDATVAGIGTFLRSLQPLVSGGGFVLIRECYHESVISDELGSRIVFWLSSAQFPEAFRQLLRFAGLKAAGGGVCFLSRRQWIQVFKATGLHVVSSLDSPVRSPHFKLFGFKANGDLFHLLRFQ